MSVQQNEFSQSESPHVSSNIDQEMEHYQSPTTPEASSGTSSRSPPLLSSKGDHNHHCDPNTTDVASWYVI